jgi:hypothetical protein
MIVKLLRMRIAQTNGLQQDFYGRRLCFRSCGLVKRMKMYKTSQYYEKKKNGLPIALQGFVDNLESSAKTGT